MQSKTGPTKRLIELGDSNDVFIEIIAGLNEGEKVVLNPVSLIAEAEEDARTTLAQQQAEGNNDDKIPATSEAD